MRFFPNTQTTTTASSLVPPVRRLAGASFRPATSTAVRPARARAFSSGGRRRRARPRCLPFVRMIELFYDAQTHPAQRRDPVDHHDLRLARKVFLLKRNFGRFPYARRAGTFFGEGICPIFWHTLFWARRTAGAKQKRWMYLMLLCSVLTATAVIVAKGNDRGEAEEDRLLPKPKFYVGSPADFARELLELLERTPTVPDDHKTPDALDLALAEWVRELHEELGALPLTTFKKRVLHGSVLPNLRGALWYARRTTGEERKSWALAASFCLWVRAGSLAGTVA